MDFGSIQSVPSVVTSASCGPAWVVPQDYTKELFTELTKVDDLKNYYGPLNDEMISLYAREMNMITPFNDKLVRESSGEKVISHGLSSYGYDVRSVSTFKVFMPRYKLDEVDVIDPKNFDPAVFEEVSGESIIIPPHGFILTSTVETFNIPRDVTVMVLGKSTLARCGLVCIATPLEAGWSGQLVLEFCNSTPRPVKFYAGEGCAQLVFFKGVPCKTSYADRGGKYQSQSGITTARV